MATGNEIKQSTNDRLVLLREEQNLLSEGSKGWTRLQKRIDEIVAQNFLEYVNR